LTGQRFGAIIYTYTNKLGNTMQTTYTTKNGGTVTITPTGLIHKAGNAYTGKIAAKEAAQKPAKK
jgi:hypothetical protein